MKILIVMGAFFNNIQIKSTDGDTNKLRDRVIEQIIFLNSLDEYEPVENEDDADKSIIVTFPDETPWIAVYDEETVTNIDMLNHLGKELSKIHNAVALTVLVSDSDYIHLGYNKREELVDSMSNVNDQVSLETSKPDIWLELTNRTSFGDIESLWSNKTVFIENFLEEVGKLFNISPSRLLAGYYDICENAASLGTILHFAKKKSEKDSLPPEPVCLNMLSREGYTELTINESKKIKWMITNFGESSTGIDVMFAGDAIENLCIKPLTAKVSQHKQDENQKEYLCDFVETKATTGEKLFYIRIEDLYIPQGKRPVPAIKIKRWQNDGDILFNAAINMEIEFLPLKASKTELKMFVVPLANRQEGTYYEILELTVQE